jgi:serine/threonine-protein kinase RsbW
MSCSPASWWPRSDGSPASDPRTSTEAATNVIRHAAVESYEIEYRVLPRAVEITVIDTGGGFNVADLTRAPDGQGGFGLVVIRDLVDELALDSTEGGGTRLKMIRRTSPP